MNKPTNPVARPSLLSPLYDEDIFGWAVSQARMIRNGRFDSIDWENIAEEIENVGRSERHALESELRLLMLHLLKWEFQPSHRSRSWLASIREQHRQYRRRLDENPSLKAVIEDVRDEAYRQARVAAQVETGLAANTFPLDPPGWNVINSPPVSEDDLRGQ